MLGISWSMANSTSKVTKVQHSANLEIVAREGEPSSPTQGRSRGAACQCTACHWRPKIGSGKPLESLPERFSLRVSSESTGRCEVPEADNLYKLPGDKPLSKFERLFRRNRGIFSSTVFRGRARFLGAKNCGP